MKKVILFLAVAVVMGFPFTAVADDFTEPIISIKAPSWTNKDIAVVNILTDPLPDYCEARTDSQRDYIDVTSELNYKVKENCVLYVKATYIIGEETKEYTRSFIIDFFDRKASTCSVVQNGSKYTITARDDLSGIKAFYINDNIVEDFDFSTETSASITYKPSSRDSSFTVFVEDYAGNLSNMQTTSIDTTSTSKDDSEVGTVGNAQIVLSKPDWTNKKSTFVKVSVSGEKFDKIEAKSSRKAAWENITSTMDFKITENTDVYVRVTNTKGAITTYTEYIECFDRDAPSVNVIQDGKNINVITTDAQSETEFIFINGKGYSTNDGTASIPITENMKYMLAQAKDYAGNYSAVKTLTVDQALLGNTPAAAASEATRNINEESITGTVYNLTLGNGESYSVEELQQMGIPIYVMTDVDELTLKNMVQDVYASQTVNAANDTPAISHEVPEEAETVSEILLEEEAAPATEEIPEEQPVKKEKQQTTPLGIILIGIIILVIGIVAFLYFRKSSAKYANDDLYESEFDPDRDAYSDDDEDNESLELGDISY